LNNKTVIITGGTRGIGASLVKSFLTAGANIIVTGTSVKAVEGFKNLNKNDKIEYHSLDFLSKKSIKNFLDIIEGLDRVDCLINNAGINKINPIFEISEKEWDEINNVNLRGPFLLTKNVSKKMKIQNFGRIINIASIFGVVSKKKRVVYSSTKSALIGFTRALALDMAPFNVLVNAISPGFIDTDLTRKILSKKEINNLTKRIPLQKLGDPVDISNIALFLCSDKNRYITGQNFIVDGGFTNV